MGQGGVGRRLGYCFHIGCRWGRSGVCVCGGGPAQQNRTTGQGKQGGRITEESLCVATLAQRSTINRQPLKAAVASGVGTIELFWKGDRTEGQAAHGDLVVTHLCQIKCSKKCALVFEEMYWMKSPVCNSLSSRTTFDITHCTVLLHDRGYWYRVAFSRDGHIKEFKYEGTQLLWIPCGNSVWLH